MERLNALVVLILLLCNSSQSQHQQKHPLYFSYITTITGGIRAIGGKPVVDLALEEINNRTDILQNYTLGYTTIRNSQCTRTAALDSFFQDFPFTSSESLAVNESTTTSSRTFQQFHALLCCGCSPATIPVAEISHYWNIPQISFAVGDTQLIDRSKFKNMFRTLPSLENIAISLIELVRHFNWKQMAIISQDETLFTGVNGILRYLFHDEGYLLDESAVIPTNDKYFTNEVEFPFDTAFSWMENNDFRVITINAYAEYTYMILCEAHKLRLLPPQYVWITPMWYNREWWKPISKHMSAFTCSESELLEVLYGSIGVVPDGYFVQENDTADTFSKTTPEMFKEEYTKRLSLSEYDNLEELGVAGVAYDTIWAIALALDKVSHRVISTNDSGCEHIPGHLVPLEEFTYTNQKMGCLFRKCLEEIEFTGITGQIMYDSVGSRPDNTLLVQQYRNLSSGVIERETVAKEVVGPDMNITFMFIEGEQEATLWTTGVPYDGSVVEVTHGNNIVLAVFCYCLATMGLAFALSCLVFNILCRNKKVVKLSSPNLNYLIIVGAAILYSCIYLFATPYSDENVVTVICNLRIWIFSFGYTLCFAVILSKTWRIYYIFNNPTTKKKTIKDWILVIMICVAVSIDLLILLAGTSVPRSRLYAYRVQDKKQFKHVTEDGINEEYYIYVCTVNSVIWIAVSFAYKGLLQLVAIFMAFHIRKVRVKALNDSKETAAIIYFNSIILVLLSVATFVLEGYQDAYSALFCVALLIQGTLFLGLLFIPKVISLIKDPSGEKVMNMSNGNDVRCSQRVSAVTKDNGVSNNAVTFNVDPLTKMKELKEQLKSLEATHGIIKESDSNSISTVDNSVE